MIDSNTLITNFHSQFKDDYSHISPAEMKLICHAEFDMLREIVGKGELEEVRLQYLFTSRPSVPKVIQSLKSIYVAKEKGTIKEEDFIMYNTMLTNFIAANKKKVQKYRDILEKLNIKID